MTQLTAYQKLFTDDHVHYVVNVVMLLFDLLCPHFSEFNFQLRPLGFQLTLRQKATCNQQQQLQDPTGHSCSLAS